MGGVLLPNNPSSNAAFQQVQEAIRAMGQQNLLNRYNEREIRVEDKLLAKISEVSSCKCKIDAYTAAGIPVPKHLTRDYEKAIAEAKAAYRAQKEQELAAARAQIEELKSREQKREDVAKRIAELEEELG